MGVRSARMSARPRGDGAGRRGRGAARAADPLQHGQPARQRARGAGVPRRPPRPPPASSASCSAPSPSAPTSSRGCAATPGADGPDAVLPRPRRHGARRPGRVDARPVVGRPRRRLPLGARRARHEVAGRGRGRRGGLAGALGLAPGARASCWSWRSSTRRPAARSARSGSPRRHPDKVRCDLLSTRAAAACSNTAGAAPLRGLLRREGRVPLHGHHRRRRRPRLDAGDGRQRAAEDGAAARALRRAPALLRADRRAARVPARRSARTPTTRRARSRACARADPRLATMFEPMLGVTFTPTRISASEKINVIPSRAELKVDCRVPPGLGEEEVRGGDRRGARRATAAYAASSSPSASSATARRSRSPLMDAISRLDRRARPRRARCVPVILPGFTDSRHFRAGVSRSASPTASSRSATSRCCETAPLIHGADERIDVRDLAFATELFATSRVRVLG